MAERVQTSINIKPHVLLALRALALDRAAADGGRVNVSRVVEDLVLERLAKRDRDEVAEHA